MYAVVGCPDCEALWVVEGSPETSECPRCGRTRSHDARKRFYTTDEPDEAREARARLLAARQGYGDVYDDMDSFAEMADHLAAAGPDDDTYLAAAGIDPEAVAAAGETDRPASASRQAVVRAALRDLEEPTAEDVVSYAAERGLPEDYVETALAKLVRAGEITESGGTYRPL